MTHDPLFLTDDELAELTGRRVRRLQIAALKQMMIPFRINALGRPVVTRAAVLGMQTATAAPATRRATQNLKRSEPPARRQV